MPIALVKAIEDIKKLKKPSIENLWEQFIYHFKVMLDCIKEGHDGHYEVVSRNTPEIVLNLFMHGPIERGLNAAEGGVDNNSLCIDGIGLATVADSIAEKWAIRIRDFFVEYAKNPTPKYHLKIIPGMFSHGDVFAYGKLTPATPNGRFNNEQISHSNDPDPGFARGIDAFAASLKATAVAKTQPGLGDSAPLQLDIDYGMMNTENGINALTSLIHTHNHMGGTLINLNCLSKEQLLAANEDPSKYPDLVVRVTGY